MDINAMVKSPAAIAVGVAVGALLLFSASKGGGAVANNAGSNLASQSIATNADIAFSQDQTAQRIASFDTTVALAAINAGYATENLNARTSIEALALANANNVVMGSMQAKLQKQSIEAGVTLGNAEINSRIAIQRDNNQTALALAPHQVAGMTAIAQIQASSAERIMAMQTEAQRYAVSRQADSADKASDNNFLSDVIPVVASFFL